MRSRRRGLSASRTRFRSPQRLRVASSGAGRLRVSAPLPCHLDLRVLPQAADRPAASAFVRRRSRVLASGVLPGLVLMRGRDRSPHPPVPLVHRRSPSGSHPGALVPVSRATHAWAASSPRGGRLQRLGGVASTHRPLPEGGVLCRLQRFPGDWPGTPRSVPRPSRSAFRCTSRRRFGSAGLTTSRLLRSWKVVVWRR